MNYLPLLTEDEVRYICSAIPIQDAIAYFQHNPKEFAKVRPGFRATSATISKLNIGNLLFNCRNRGFISFFIEKHIDDWLKQIQKYYEKCLQEGANKEAALLRTLPSCFFAGNIRLYFKLIEVQYSDEFIDVLSSAVKEIREHIETQESQSEKLKSKDSVIEEQNSKFEFCQAELISAKREMRRKSDEIKALELKIADVEKLNASIENKEQEIASLRGNINGQKETINRLTVELSDVANSRQLLEVQIREELEKLQITKALEEALAAKPKRPNDLNEFRDYLGYNLESLGVPSDSEYYPFLKEHLSRILFNGMPVIVSRNVGVALQKCVANALTGQSKVTTLAFEQGMSIEDIKRFMSSAGRIVCLDNFIGNYNETELLPLFDDHRGQIIFLTVAYDRMLQYVSEEFFRYCHYLNLNRIAALAGRQELSEDPSIVQEVEHTYQRIASDNRFSSLLRDVIREFGFHRGLVERICSTIYDEQDLCRVLAFEVLPYCVDVLKIAPYNHSERFVKYAGDTGRCPCKNLFKRWFSL